MFPPKTSANRFSGNGRNNTVAGDRVESHDGSEQSRVVDQNQINNWTYDQNQINNSTLLAHVMGFDPITGDCIIPPIAAKAICVDPKYNPGNQPPEDTPEIRKRLAYAFMPEKLPANPFEVNQGPEWTS